jgi:peptide/nickel transport system substrate-binding protein
MSGLRTHRLGYVLAVGATAAHLAACGGGGGSGGSPSGASTAGAQGGGTGKPIVVGTTDKVVSFDPAGSYDLGSWTPMFSMYQTLMRFPPGETTPTPDAAKACQFTDPTHYECTLRPGQTFWNGDPVDAAAVVYSFERNVKIASPQGASSLLAEMKSVAAKGSDTVVFTLKQPFAVFPFVLSDPSNAIVDPKVFPADKVIANDKIVGSGPYELASYQTGQQLVLKPNPHYAGTLKLHNSGVVVRYYTQPSALKLDIEQGNIDVAYRTFSPTDIASLRGESSKGVEVVSGEGAEIQYIVFNLKKMPGSSDAQKLAIRQAVSMIIDRQQIAESDYDGTVSPLYSMVPDALAGHIDAFKTAYGASPDPAKAKQVLQAAGVTTPVTLDLWWTPSHYGETSADMYTTIKRQLEATGLFKVNLHSAEWATYSGAFPTDQYPAFQLGWFPDYPDSDDYVAPFYGSTTSFLNSHFSNKEVDAAIAAERASTDQATRNAAFEKIQTIGAQQAPLVPIWQGKQIAVQRTGVTGVKDTLDASYTFRYWLIGKS